jgi:hypothetical protein
MSTHGNQIVDTMTIREAAARWTDSRSEKLHYWAETFGIALKDFHAGHIRTYQVDRGEQVAASQVDAEVGALLALLAELGLDQEVQRYNHSLEDASEITTADFKSLPVTVQTYIEKLRKKISDLEAANYRMENRIRKINWGRSR